jgi:hypothetical protein
MITLLEIKQELSKRLKPAHTYVPCGGDSEWYFDSVRRRRQAEDHHYHFLNLVATSIVQAGIEMDQIDELMQEYDKQRELLGQPTYHGTSIRPAFFQAQDEQLHNEEDRNEKAMILAIMEIVRKKEKTNHCKYCEVPIPLGQIWCPRCAAK